ncbi:MAG: LytR C-terminal domain-containing protein, partial [Actinomycetota bacterium]|nr:LytR C-terminal domain-containing protein [Actinomycetota bacterium]
RWDSLAGAVAPVVVDLPGDLVATAADGTSVVRFAAGPTPIPASGVVDFFAHAGVVGEADRVDRQRDWWQAWLESVGSGDPTANLPALDLDVVHLLATVAGGRVRVPVGPWMGAADAPTIDRERLADLVVAMFPVPIPRAPGLRPTVRLLNGTGDYSTDVAAREAVLRAGVELVVVGNYRTEGAIQTRVLYRDPTHLAAAEDLAAAIGGGVLFEELLSPVTDLTVVIGSDFMPGG